jgi:hypothetical protein
MRKRGVRRLVGEDLAEASAWVDESTAARLRRLNTVAATSFLLGGSLFALGAALAQAGVSVHAYCSVYLAGGAFFSTGGPAGVLQVRAARDPGPLAWSSAVVLFVGTLVFAINIADSFIEGLGAAAENRLVWSPDMVGCALFLVSGHLAMVEMGGWLRHPRDLGWAIVVVNQVGSILFMVSAVASFIRPSTGDELAVGIANWGTLTGALCFAVAGAMQGHERPPA